MVSKQDSPFMPLTTSQKASNKKKKKKKKDELTRKAWGRGGDTQEIKVILRAKMASLLHAKE